MKRRTLVVALTGGIFAAPFAVKAQPMTKVHRIGFLSVALPATPADQGPLSERMRELGWIYGRDFVVERRAYGDRLERIPDLTAELIRAGVDIFVVTGAADAARVQQVTRVIPIVAWGAGDLVAAGLADSLAKPGANVTGIQTLQPELASKQLSLLKEALPHLSRSGVLFQTGPSRQLTGSHAAVLRDAEAASKVLGVALQIVTIHQPDELEAAFSLFRAKRAQAVVIIRNQFMGSHLKTLVALALKYRLPTISDMLSLATQGGLISYGFSFSDTMRMAGDIVDKILRGAKAGEIPIRQATMFHLLINLATAKALGIAIPPSLLARADQVIQ